MKRIMLFIFPLIFSIVIFSAVVYFMTKANGKGALQITSNPKSNAYLNGKLIGATPICKCEGNDTLIEGEYTLKLVPLEEGLLPFSEKIKITKSILTVVDRSFGKGSASEGSIIALEPLSDKKAVELVVLSFPEGSQVLVDSAASGNTPILLKNLTPSDHEVKMIKDGYKEKSIRIKTTPGYKLTISAYLGINLEINPTPIPLSFPSAVPTPTSFSPRVLILQTPTGFLNIRESGSFTASIAGQVNPGEIYELISEKDNWFEIKFKDGKTGWINSQYAKKQ